MKCPNCAEVLVMTSRNNIEIDYCPNCRGVWLDKGELDKIIERSAETSGNKAQFRDDDDDRRYEQDDKYRGDDKYRSDDKFRNDQNKYGQRKKRGFLGDLFDFD